MYSNALKKLFLFLLAFFLIFSFIYGTKLVSIDDSYYNNYLKKSYGLGHNKNIKIISDSDYNKLLKSNKTVRIIAETNNSNITPFQLYSVASINANYLWNNDFTGSNLKLGVVDSGISYNSDALTNKIFAARDFTNDNNVECIDDSEHGCLVSSVMVGKPSLSNNNYKGVAYDANIVSGKIFNHLGSVPFSVNIPDVFDWVMSQGVNFINNSWGSPKYYNYNCDNPTGVISDGSDNALIWDFYDYNKAISGNRVLLIFSSGNDGSCGEYSLSNDCSAYNNICVGSVNDYDTNNRGDDIYSSFSSQGPTDDNRKKPDLVAPGQSIYSMNYNSWEYWSGTSTSNPHVTASAGLLSQLGLNSLEIKSLVINSSDDINSIGWDKYTGWGYINLQTAYDQNSFVNEYIFSDNNDYFILDSNEIAKCTLVWRREFDGSEPLMKNLDLYSHKSNEYNISNSLIDNVEQVYLSNSNTNSYVKVYCEDNCLDANYALACNLDYNKIDLNYVLDLKDSNNYVSNNDGAFKLYFDFLNVNNEINDLNLDLNLDLNIYSANNSYLIDYSDLNYLQDYNLDLNLDFYPLSDYNIILDYNYLSNDFNELFSNSSTIQLSSLDNIAPIYTGDNVLYLNGNDSNYTFSFYDPNVYYLDVNSSDLGISLRDYNLDSNSISYFVDFNVDEYSSFGKHTIMFSARDIYGNSLDQNVDYYILYLLPNNYYVNYDLNNLYYSPDINDINISFYNDANKDFNLYLDNNEYSFNKDNNLFYYDFNLDLNYSRLIIKDNNLDVNGLYLDLVLDPIPVFITESITKDFNIIISDFDLNLTTILIYCDLQLINFDYLQDENNYYISGTCNSNAGTHTLDINVYDLLNGFANKSYTYTISQQGGGSGGSNSNTNLDDVITQNIVLVDSNFNKNEQTIDDYNYFDFLKIKDKGMSVIEDNKVYLLDSNGKIIDSNVKVFDLDKLIFSGNINDFNFDNYSGKRLLFVSYAGNVVLFKDELNLPKKLVMPNVDINNSNIVAMDSNVSFITEKNVYFNILFYPIIALVFILIIIYFFVKRKSVNRYKYK